MKKSEVIAQLQAEMGILKEMAESRALEFLNHEKEEDKRQALIYQGKMDQIEECIEIVGRIDEIDDEKNLGKE